MRKNAAGQVGFAGLTSCGSVWACPVCSARILSNRQEEVRQAVEAWTARGGRLVMLTLTMRHKAADSLAGLWDSLSAAWGAVTSGKLWKAEKAAHGCSGYLKVVEVTRGLNGWHVHVHALLFVAAEQMPKALERWKDAVFGRWNRALMRRRARSAALAAQDMHLVEPDAVGLREYFTKVADHGDAIAREFTMSAAKKSRAATGGRTPWQILDGVIAQGDADDLDLWHEWEAASKGRRQMTWSRGIRDLLGLGLEQTDEEITDEELGDRMDDVVTIPRAGWAAMIAEPELLPLALESLAEASPAATVALLRSAGVECFEVDQGEKAGG